MMYIEHTSLEGNLHSILTNRVPTSSSPSSTETAAAAASALLARVREAHNGATSPNNVQELQPEQASQKSWVRRPEPKLVPVDGLDPLPRTPQAESKGVNCCAAPEQEDDVEEQFELFHVVGSDREGTESVAHDSAAERDIPVSKADTERNKSTRFLLDLNHHPSPSKSDEEEEEEDEFDYIVTRVPKKRDAPHGQQHYKSSVTQNNASAGRAKRPVPDAIPIDSISQPHLYNGNVNHIPHGISVEDIREVSYLPESSIGYPSESASEGQRWDILRKLDAVEVAISRSDCDNQRCRNEAQMGLHILSKLQKLFNWNTPTSDQIECGRGDGTRKRRSDDISLDQAIKYRKVDNRFPKYVAQAEDNDDIKFVQPAPAPAYSLFHSNMSARRSVAPLDKPAPRKSLFLAPEIRQHLIRNTSYANIEFSDDDEPILASSSKHTPTLCNVSIPRPEERPRCSSNKPPPPLIEHRTGNIITSRHVPSLQSTEKISFADALRPMKYGYGRERVGLGLGLRNGSVSSSGGDTTTDSTRFLNGIGSGRLSQWSTLNQSILAREKESDDRDKYQQLLEQAVPGLYGHFADNNLQQNAANQKRRSALLLASGASSTRSSPAVSRRSINLGHVIAKRQPLSSTINIIDDDDEAVITDVSQLKLTPRPAATVVIEDDDDEISEIIDLDSAERHVLSQVGKIKREEHSALGLCTDKPKIAKKSPLPYVEPVNSLQERFSTSPHFKENWLDNLQRKWLQRKRNKLDEVKETAKEVEKLSAERKAYEVGIQERLRSVPLLDAHVVVVDDFEDLAEEPEFVELTAEHLHRIDAAIRGPPDQVLVSKFNLNITRRDIHTLCGHNWLNDEVINFYMNLLTERGDLKQSQGMPSVYAMNTFFIPRLMQAGHSGVKRWTRKVDILSKDVIPVPVHVSGVHWCMAIIHLKERCIRYYDSMGAPNPTVLKALEQYIKEESLDKRKQPLDTSSFIIESVANVPRQMNGSDCGVFSCMFAEYITRGREITFTQQHMEYFRQKMILEIVTGSLLQ